MPLKLEPGATFGLPMPPCLRRRPTWSLPAVGGMKVWSLMQLGDTFTPTPTVASGVATSPVAGHERRRRSLDEDGDGGVDHRMTHTRGRRVD